MYVRIPFLKIKQLFFKKNSLQFFLKWFHGFHRNSSAGKKNITKCSCECNRLMDTVALEQAEPFILTRFYLFTCFPSSVLTLTEELPLLLTNRWLYATKLPHAKNNSTHKGNKHTHTSLHKQKYFKSRYTLITWKYNLAKKQTNKSEWLVRPYIMFSLTKQ